MVNGAHGAIYAPLHAFCCCEVFFRALKIPPTTQRANATTPSPQTEVASNGPIACPADVGLARGGDFEQA